MPKKVPSVMRVVGQKFRKERKRIGDTQLDMAVRLGLGPGYYSRMESGGTNIDLCRFIQFCRVLKRPPAQVIEELVQLLVDGPHVYEGGRCEACGLIQRAGYEPSAPCLRPKPTPAAAD